LESIRDFQKHFKKSYWPQTSVKNTIKFGAWTVDHELFCEMDKKIQLKITFSSQIKHHNFLMKFYECAVRKLSFLFSPVNNTLLFLQKENDATKTISKQSLVLFQMHAIIRFHYFLFFFCTFCALLLLNWNYQIEIAKLSILQKLPYIAKKVFTVCLEDETVLY